MSDTVERLAEKRAAHFGPSSLVVDTIRNDARWWFRAIAEELPPHVEGMLAARWLRDQAEADPERYLRWEREVRTRWQRYRQRA